MKTLLFTILPVLFLFSSCKKEDSKTNSRESTTYINTKSGSSWTYHEINSSGSTAIESDYTITSTNRDTTINNRSYHIYDLSFGGNRYLNITGKDYFEFDTLPGQNKKPFERLYLKGDASIGTSWTQSEKLMLEGVEIPITITNTIVENSLTKVINGRSYDKVVHVSSKITSLYFPGNALKTDIHSYYAPNYGLIENTTNIELDYLTLKQTFNISTTLKSADLK
ncbi:MAG: hypothetical protein ABIN48_01200 [Ginsengibacter sp.]